MSNIAKPIVKDNTYFGLTKISLASVWEIERAGYSNLTPMAFAEYATMRKWLKETDTLHKFEWTDHGSYLPDYLWIDSNSDSATYFKLKYGL